MKAADLLLQARGQLAGAPQVDALTLRRQQERQGQLEGFLGELRGILDDLGASAEYFEHKAALHQPAAATHAAAATASPQLHDGEALGEWSGAAVAGEEPVPIQHRPRR